ncbi:CU044_2847 family protein [Streptomyces sp. NBC_01443]|uniref:CU044_2847 family protein n=1 Tax=Streptomyces sp. NBC_01443 TaxID=2903868 RepID=UPI0022510821|nr:CU044_2847 family protein [Streptomyces sp. NBC_01443]MCX4632242.1 CU044_2847 family protein [Streptomyces sp. NBC_01443]
MSYHVELPIDVPGGPQDVVRFEIAPIGENGLVRVARPGQLMARASRSLGEMVTGIRPVAQSFVDGFRGMVHGPDELNLEFGLSLSAEADVVISSTAAQANFKISLTWNRPPSDGTSAPSELAAEPAQ